MEYISNQTEFIRPPIQLSTFWALNLLFYLLKRNVPSYLTLTFTNTPLWENKLFWEQIKLMETTRRLFILDPNWPDFIVSIKVTDQFW